MGAWFSTWNEANEDGILTVDDGPTNNTNKLLNTLDQYHAKATFFMLMET